VKRYQPVFLLAATVVFGGCGGGPPDAASTSDDFRAKAPLAELRKGTRGINVSSNQGRIDWEKVAKSDIKFAIVRASFGGDADPRFEENLSGARAKGLRVGAYHRLEPQGGSQKARDRRATEHAQTFVGQAKKFSDPGDLVPVLDVEPPFGGLTAKELERWIRILTAEVEKELGVKAMIYTSADVWEESVGDSTAFAKNGHPLWIADIDTPRPQLPAHAWGSRGWAIWQRQQRENIPGVDSLVDVNVFDLRDEHPLVLAP
jgi:GH25 family lysozyme M1 (1,4-beta-N-acetylmuramidase)